MSLPFSILWRYLPHTRSPLGTSAPAENTDSQGVLSGSDFQPLRYLVTGTGRSGTVSLAQMLSSVGIRCGHERIFRGESAESALALLHDRRDAKNSVCSTHSGLLEWDDGVIAESSYLAVPYLAAPFLAETTIIHAVRSPWKVIPSFLNHIQFFSGEPFHKHERFIYSVLPEFHQRIRSPVDRAIYFYIHWNLLIEWLGTRKEPAQYIFHRVEDGPEALLRRLDVPEEEFHKLPQRNDLNTFKAWERNMKPGFSRHFHLQELRASPYWDELCCLAQRYGYESLPEWPEEEKDQPLYLSADLDEPPPPPRLVEENYRGFNVVVWVDFFYGLDQAIGAMDLETTPYSRFQELADRGMCFRGKSLTDVKDLVDGEMQRRKAARSGRA